MSWATEIKAKAFIKTNPDKVELAKRVAELHREADNVIDKYADSFDWIRVAHKLRTEAHVYQAYLDSKIEGGTSAKAK